MAIPTDELLQEDFSFPVKGYDIEQIRQSIANRIPLVGSQRGVYGGGPIGGGGFNLAGGYVPIATDPTYSSGFRYAQQIAGGMPFEQVVAPGMSFSPEQPMGYTQADLNVVNLPRDVAPVFPTPPATTGQVARPSQPMMPYAPTGTPMPERFIPSAQKFFPDVLPNFFGQIPQFDFSNIDLSKIQIPEDVTKSLRESLGFPEIDTSKFVTKEELPSFIPSIPSFEMPQIPQIDTSQFIGRQELPNILAGLPQAPQVDVSRFIGREELPSLLKDIPLNIPKIDTSQFVSREDISGLRSDILGSLPQIKMPDTSQFLTQQDISGLRSDILGSLPQIRMPDTSQFLTQQDISGLRSDILGSIPQPQLPDISRFVTQQDISGLRSDILGSLPQVQMPDVSQFVTQQDINRAISGIPQISLSDIEARLAALESTPSIGVPKLPRPTGLFA